MGTRLACTLVAIALLVPSAGYAQPETGDTPPAETPPAETPPGQTPADALAVPAPPAEGQPPPGTLPPATAPGQIPASLVVGPLVTAAEQDLAAGRASLALARATVAIDALAQGEPLRVRAEGLSLLAQQRADANAPSPGFDEVLAPMVAQAELDVRSSNGALAIPRLDFALARLPPGTPLYQRAAGLRELALRSSVAPGGAAVSGPATYGQPSGYGQPPAYQPPPRPPRPPRDPNQRGIGEAIDLYVTAGLFGALTGGWVPFVSSNGTASAPVYTLTVLGGAGLFFVGALALDLSVEPRSGIEPTIAASTRFGFANGLFGLLIYDQLSSDCPPAPAACSSTDPNVSFSLVWAGTATGAALGIALGFGLEPEVRDERFVESAGVWGAGLAGSVAMLTDFQDQAAVGAIGMAGLNAGWLIGALTLAGGAKISVGRTLFLDMGFIGGFGVGMLAPLLGYYVAEDSPEWIALGIGSLIGSIAGWSTMLAITDGWSEDGGARTAPDEPRVRLGVSPIQNGAVLGVDGTF